MRRFPERSHSAAILEPPEMTEEQIVAALREELAEIRRREPEIVAALLKRGVTL